ncbi:MAG: class I SAM-dependent methyltransferase [candidate division KSB1 bacterium]|nr:class I SAM-dependent methyltransferase [candidate division KSB1 bacterium]MDZ7287113.1 class I SAM-dependent methyltransferase [candidate division KSB1 bacterium]MDZ7296962.1 class I SAM-dependent methyltransferase [candidate division KSB1 bacterium]MDZ7383711.1 class I SAM-dependent methyltransferase [candidate division KSB1 bacterium]MDZ7394314.1 class I SAM-dependent methyltransferase [candidate division KSB1 bacterium]
MDGSHPTQLEEIRLRDAQAASYAEFIKSHRGKYWMQAQTGLLLHALKIRNGLRLYDAAAGVGLYTLEVARRHPTLQILASDFSAASLAVLQEQARQAGVSNIQTQAADITRFCPAEAGFDRVVCLDTIQHLPTPAARLQALRNFHTLLVPDGLLVLSAYRWGGWIRPPQPKEESNHLGSGLYRMAFTEEEIATLLQSAGFRHCRVFGIIRLPGRLRKRLPAMLAYPVENMLIQLGWRKQHAQYVMAVAGK